MSNIEKHLSLLGLQVKDRVTGMTGIVVSVSFDLYGCVQAIVHPGLTPDGKPAEQHWFDIARLDVRSNTPVMPQPDYDDQGAVAEGRKGPADKPAIGKP